MQLFTAEQEKEIVNAIRLGEQGSTGEIKLHLEKKCVLPAIERATSLFCFLNMDQLKSENAVLIYIDIEDRRFAIVGGRQLNAKVSDDFWDNLSKDLGGYFSKSEFSEGVISVIKNIGVTLRALFPDSNNLSANNLSDEISKS